MKRLLARSLCLALSASTQAGNTLLCPDNANLIIVAMNQTNGSPILFDSKPVGQWLNIGDYVDSSTIGMLRQSAQVGSEIWISDQTSDLIYRFSAQFENPRFLGSIGIVPNPRGLSIVNGEVWVASGTLNSTGGVVRSTTNGQLISSFDAENPFDVFPNNATSVLTSNIFQNRLEKFSSASGDLGTFGGAWGSSTLINFPMQMIRWYDSGNSRVVVVGYSGDNPGLYVYQSSDGVFVKRLQTIAILTEVTVTDPRGVAVLGTGELAWSSSQGIFALNTGTNQNRTLYIGENFSCNFINPVNFGLYCAGDLNNDSLVDDNDFSIFAVAYDGLLCPTLPSGFPAGCPADLNGDGFVDDQDFPIFVVAYDSLLCP